MKSFALAMLVAVIGAVAGYLAFVLLLRIGLYALVAPGALIGVGASLARCRSVAVPIACGVLAVAASILAEWLERPFAIDESLSFFIAHLGELTLLTKIFAVLGVAAAVWFSWPGRAPTPRAPGSSNVRAGGA